MCGRFTLTASPTDVEEELGIEIPSFPPSHNIAPTEEILAIAAIHTAPKACFFIGALSLIGQNRRTKALNRLMLGRKPLPIRCLLNTCSP